MSKPKPFVLTKDYKNAGVLGVPNGSTMAPGDGRAGAGAVRPHLGQSVKATDAFHECRPTGTSSLPSKVTSMYSWYDAKRRAPVRNNDGGWCGTWCVAQFGWQWMVGSCGRARCHIR